MVGMGIAIFIYSIILFWRTYRILEEKKISLLWIILAFLVIFFLFGYIAFEYLLITEEEIISIKTLISQIFFWGAVFVLICATLFHSTFIVRKQMEETLLISNKKLRQEIIERKEAEKKLHAEKERFRLAAQSLSDVVYEWDMVSSVQWFGNIDELLGYAPGEFPRTLKAWLDILHPGDRDRVWTAVERHLKGESAYETEYRVRHNDGTWRHWLARGSVLKDASGKPNKWVGAITDITERKKAEEEIRKLNEELEQKVIQRTAQLESANKELEAFSYSVSHDLRAPLRTIDGFSIMLIEDHYDKLDDEGKRLLNTIRDNTNKMGSLIEDLLKLSRIGRKDIEHSEIDMDKLAKAVFAEIKATVPEREIQLDIKPLPAAYGDEGLIRQVFFNLLFNAIKFTRYKENSVIEVGGNVKGPENVYYVKDNGVGFDMQYADKLFGTFQRLHSDKEFEGTGIGLAIVQRIIHRHGGRIWAEGKVNEGATFYFSLPKKEEIALRREKMFI
jgi:PAS domain S-box-containing protein